MLIDAVQILGRLVLFVRAGLQLPKGQSIIWDTLEGLLEPSQSSTIPKHIMVARNLKGILKCLLIFKLQM